MKIAILGTKGIPNNYGGFEQFAEYLGIGLVKNGHEVTVYNSSLHPFNENNFKGIEIIKKYCPEDKVGSIANFYFDWICSRDAQKKDFDIIYHAGYQSAAPAIWFYASKSKSIWITNMDGIEWKRDKWSKPVKLLTKIMEKIAIKYSDFLISDNIGIQEYYIDSHNESSFFLAYGANIPDFIDKSKLNIYDVKEFNYSLIIARLEPENSIELILNGYSISETNIPILVIGNNETKYGKKLKLKFSKNKNIRFIGAVYEKENLDVLRKYANFYFHGHTVGGTNPSLLEAMAVGSRIVAHNNSFNRSVIKNNGYFFSNENDIIQIIREFSINSIHEYRDEVIEIIKTNYSWDYIIEQHIKLFSKLIKK
jgi:glycosyltransferase involved in cell wall biosynthesis